MRSNRMIIANKESSAASLINKVKKDKEESLSLAVPNSKVMINFSSKNIGQLYENYRDPDDGILYLELLGANSFGN